VNYVAVLSRDRTDVSRGGEVIDTDRWLTDLLKMRFGHVWISLRLKLHSTRLQGPVANSIKVILMFKK